MSTLLYSQETYRLSIGKIFHELIFNLQETSITVKVQQPQKTVRVREVQYRYQFMSPDCDDYHVSVTKFASEQPENYKWNLLDNYVINRGFKDDENREMFKINSSVSLIFLPSYMMILSLLIDLELSFQLSYFYYYYYLSTV